MTEDKQNGKTATKDEDLVKSIEELKSDVRELRDLVNMLVDIIINMEGEEVQEYDANFGGLENLDKFSRFSM